MHRNDFRAHQPHAEHIRRLTFHVFCPHIYPAFQAEQRTGQCCRHAVLTGSGFGNNFRFSHPFCQQCLAEHLVGFMCTAVQ